MEAEEQQLTAEEEGGGGRAVRALRRRLPCLRWGARYSRLAAVADLVAGLTLGLTLVPQSIAYAALADLPVQYGLYSAFVGTVVYMFFGTVKEVSIGPTSLMALMTLQICRGLPIEFVVLLTFLSGILVMLMGLLKLGFLVELISPSVTSGFTSGTAIIIVVSQLKGLLGLSFVAESVPENLGLIAHSLDQVRLPDLALSAICCTALLLLRKVKDLPVSPKRAFLRKTLWLISIARNALVVCIASTVAYCLHDPEKPLFKLSGRVEAGLPPLSLPSFSVTMENRTLGFLEMAERLTPGLYMMPVIMVLANIAIAKAFTSGGRVDATQEMLTLGLCNMLGALVHAMPTCGAFTRSAVSHSSGVRTPAAGLYSGILTLLALNYMTQYFYFIPKACLSSVLICAVIFMIDVQRVARLWRTARGEAAVTAATCAAAAASSAPTALVAGALASLAALLAAALRAPAPPRTHQVEGVEVLVVEAPPVLAYINAETFAARLHKLGVRGKCPLLLDCSSVAVIDHSARQVLERVMAKLRSLGAPLLVFGLSGAALRAARGLPGTRVAALRARGAAAALRAYAAPSDPADPTDPADPADPTDPAHLHNSKEMETLLQNGNV